MITLGINSELYLKVVGSNFIVYKFYKRLFQVSIIEIKYFFKSAYVE